MRNYKVKDVASYIEGENAAARPHLRELREIIKSTVPKAEEGIGWGVPIYKYQGLLAGFTALKNHVDFGLVSLIEEGDRKNLEEKGYKTGKKTVQIRFDQKVPTSIIRQILKAKAKANEAKQELKSKK